MRSILVVFFAAILVAGAWYLLPADTKADTGPAVGPAPGEQPAAPRLTGDLPAMAPGEEVEEVERMPAPRPVASVDTTEGTIRLPDGTFLPNLNGVKSHDAVRWGGGPFPKVSHKILDQKGLEWYVLEGGYLLTTVNMPGTDEHGQPVHRDLIILSRRNPETYPSKLLDQTGLKR